MAKLTAQQVYSYAIAGGFSPLEAEQATIISYMESGWNDTAVNTSAAGGKWGPAVGLMQIRALVSPPSSGVDSYRDAAKLADPTYNMQAAYAIFTADGGWSTGGWTTYAHVQAQDSTYQTALAAAQASSQSGGVTAQNAVSWSDLNPLTWGQKLGQGLGDAAQATTAGASAFSAALPAIADLDTILKHLIDPKFWVRIAYGWVAWSLIGVGFIIILASNKSAQHGVARGVTAAQSAGQRAAVAGKGIVADAADAAAVAA